MFPDLRHAVRHLLTKPGFTVVALLTLALGIGVNTTMFTILNTIVLKRPPFRDPDRLASVFYSTQ
jgi:putative ABC transport system permease protein